MNALPRTVAGWLSAYQAGASARDLLDQARQQCLGLQSAVWIHPVSDDEFESQLAALDAVAARFSHRDALLQAYPLFGVPYAVKDNIDIAGVRTTAACRRVVEPAPQHAAVIDRLQAAGAVWLGKTNLDQFATGLVGTRSPYGAPHSVFSASHVSGGSSSGSAVAVAGGGVAFSLGTDTAGSGRIPAGFNELVGLKPTPGRVSTRGVLPACRSLDCVSVFAHTVEDAGHVLAVMEGFDVGDDYSDFRPGPAAWPSTHLRMGVPAAVMLQEGSGYEGPWQTALQQAQDLGHTLVPIDFTPLHRVAELLYSGPWLAERHAVVCELLSHSPELLDPTVRRVIDAAQHYSATDAFVGQYELKALQRQLLGIWEGVDALLVPTAPGHPSLAQVRNDPIGANAALGRYTNFVNLLGWSALALPAGRTAAGLPFGVTFIAPGGFDAALLDLGRQWQQQVAWPGHEPASFKLKSPQSQATVLLAVVGAHLSGMPLNHQLTERGARPVSATTTAPNYRLFALANTAPPKPGLLRVTEKGAAIAVEVWQMPTAALGSFLALIPHPLGLGQLELADGRWVTGFICESHALQGALDITSFGAWRAYLQAQQTQPTTSTATTS
ncbi:MAG: allophanate hydrolase [Burkholderiales bacterium]